MDETNNKNNSINLWDILNTNIENFSANQNTVPQINKNDSDKEINTINLDNIKIEEVDNSKKDEKIIFDDIELVSKEKKHYRINYRKIFIISFLTIAVTVGVSMWLRAYNNYINEQATSTETSENKFISNINKVKDFLNNYLGLNLKHWAADSYNIMWEDWINNLNAIINSKANFIQKKDILTTAVKNLNSSILSNHKTLENLKKSISKEWFLSKEIGDIISNEEQISSIYNSLLSLESIKFSSAINVFPYLDTFIEWLAANTNNISKSDIEEKNKKIITRGEKDINLYLRNCYLNPFETSYDCNVIWDFEQHYSLTNDKNFDTEFFKSLIKYTDAKLEQSELPSFSIDFKKFDKSSNKISFSIDINTFKQDEIELAKKWILSPHVFILNNLVNNLKQSKFIFRKMNSSQNIKSWTKNNRNRFHWIHNQQFK